MAARNLPDHDILMLMHLAHQQEQTLRALADLASDAGDHTPMHPEHWAGLFGTLADQGGRLVRALDVLERQRAA